MAAEITDYITNARKNNLTDEQIRTKLVSVGWPEEQVASALAQGVDLPVPPPPPAVAHVGMWTGFLYILFFISLYVLASSIAGVFNTWIDKIIPPVNSSFTSDFIDSAAITRGYISAIIVSYPIFLVLALILKKQLGKQPLVANLRSRKILIYITLIGTFLIMLGNIITTGYDFLSGNITSNALGHLLVTILIAGSIFVYYIVEVKHDRKEV